MESFARTIDLDSQSDMFYILAYGDVHWGSIDCDKKAFIDTLKRYKDVPNVYYVSLGDELNAIPVRDDRHQLSDLDPDIVMRRDKRSFRDDIISAQIEDYGEKCLSLIPKERDLGHTSGNHPAKLAVRTSCYDASEEFCRRAGLLHLGYSWMYRLDIRIRGHRRATLTMTGHHGFGGSGKSVTADKNNFIRHATMFRNQDISLYGHTHRRWYEMQQYYDLSQRNEPRVHTGLKHVACCGAYLHTLSTRPEPSYSEIGGFTPVPMGSWLIANKVITKHGLERVVSWFVPAEMPLNLTGGPTASPSDSLESLEV